MLHFDPLLFNFFFKKEELKILKGVIQILHRTIINAWKFSSFPWISLHIWIPSCWKYCLFPSYVPLPIEMRRYQKQKTLRTVPKNRGGVTDASILDPNIWNDSGTPVPPRHSSLPIKARRAAKKCGGVNDATTGASHVETESKTTGTKIISSSSGIHGDNGMPVSTNWQRVPKASDSKAATEVCKRFIYTSTHRTKQCASYYILNIHIIAQLKTEKTYTQL